MTLEFVSYGGGVQSTSLLVLAKREIIRFRTFVFSDVGYDSEDPDTLTYVRLVARPFAALHGLDLHTVSKTRIRGVAAGTVETLYQRLTRPGSKSLPIPVRMSNGAPGTRSCTFTYKIEEIGKWAKAHGATPDNPATVGIGISLDEISRVNSRRAMPYEQPVYPLLEHEPPISRGQCEQIILSEPLPEVMVDPLREHLDLLPRITQYDLRESRFTRLPRPPKSACWFCPLHRPSTWAEMRRDRPELFERSAQLEDHLNAVRDDLGKDHVYLTRFGKPLRAAIPAAQDQLFDMLDDHGSDESCDNGACFT